MNKRNINPALMEQLLKGTQNQEVKPSFELTSDPAFPFYKIPVDEKGTPLNNVVYFPKSVVKVVDGEEVYAPLTLYAHRCRQGKSYPSYRCTASLQDEVYNDFGYDGECPFCSAVPECWDLYNKKLEILARERGIDIKNDTTDTLKSDRQNLLSEMAIKNADEMVIFPIVVISNTGFVPKSAQDVVCKPYYHVMRMQTFMEKIVTPLQQRPLPINSPAGLFYSFQYAYDTKGKPANVRDAGRSAQYVALLDDQTLAALKPYVEMAEKAAEKFTAVQAAMCYIPGEFLHKDEQSKIVDNLMKQTRSLIASLEAGETATAALGANSVAGALAAFGATPVQAEVPQISTTAPVDQSAPAGAAFGGTPAQPMAQPMQTGVQPGVQPAPVQSAPVQTGVPPTQATAPAQQSAQIGAQVGTPPNGAAAFGAVPVQTDGQPANGAAAFGGFGGSFSG